MVIRAFDDGATAEEIVQRYPTLTLGDTYSVIGYYLKHPDEARRYLAHREGQAAEVRHLIERDQSDLSQTRERLQLHRLSHN